ncbi:MAG TPA: YIP1 family protein [Candidatus Eisenbacteria bacterium]|uniref:YIP1 family protein n=1 Tax=Eiseniibacteriota bacterium TaxID=2212470 RepID=A0A7V2ATZ0_UNCEI|nr:YIP1 family protein [Candidatus Eisenbacteria bacterium]
MTNDEGRAGGEMEVQGGFLQSILDIFIDPMKVFHRIRGGLTWWKPFVLAAAVGVLNAYLTMPFAIKRIELNPRDLSPEQLEASIEQVEKFGFVGLIITPVIFILIYLIMAGVAHIAINIMSSESDFRKTLSLVSYTGLISILGQIITTVILRMRGLENIETMEDMRVSLSLAAFFPDLKGVGYAFLESLSIFSIWYYILFLLGTAVIFRMSRSRALVPVVIMWLLSFVFASLGSLFGGM